MIGKIRIHKEGHKILLVSGIILLIATLSAAVFFRNITIYYITAAVSIGNFQFCSHTFFRIPSRKFNSDDNMIIAPADGRIVVIEEVQESEYFGDKRIQVSIFMSPANVHINRNPIGGLVKYQKVSPGQIFSGMVHPKSSRKEWSAIRLVIECHERNRYGNSYPPDSRQTSP